MRRSQEKASPNFFSSQPETPSMRQCIKRSWKQQSFPSFAKTTPPTANTSGPISRAVTTPSRLFSSWRKRGYVRFQRTQIHRQLHHYAPSKISGRISRSLSTTEDGRQTISKVSRGEFPPKPACCHSKSSWISSIRSERELTDAQKKATLLFTDRGRLTKIVRIPVFMNF